MTDPQFDEANASLSDLQKIVEAKKASLNLNSLTDTILWAQLNSQFLMHKDFPSSDHWFCDSHWRPYASASLIGLSCEEAVVAPLYYQISRQLSRCANCARVFHEEMALLESHLLNKLGVSRLIVDRFTQSVNMRHRTRLVARLKTGLTTDDSAALSPRIVGELTITTYELLAAPGLFMDDQELFALFEQTLFKLQTQDPSLPKITRNFPGLIALFFGQNTTSRMYKWAKSILDLTLSLPLDEPTYSTLSQIFDNIYNFDHQTQYYQTFFFNLDYFLSRVSKEWLHSHCHSDRQTVVLLIRHMLAQQQCSEFFTPLLSCFVTLIDRIGLDSFIKGLRLVRVGEVIDSIVQNPAFQTLITSNDSISCDNNPSSDLSKWILIVFSDEMSPEDILLRKSAQTIAELTLKSQSSSSLSNIRIGFHCLKWVFNLLLADKIPILSDTAQILAKPCNDIVNARYQVIMSALQSEDIELQRLASEIAAQSVMYVIACSVKLAPALSSQWSNSCLDLWTAINLLPGRGLISILVESLIKSFKYLAFVHQLPPKGDSSVVSQTDKFKNLVLDKAVESMQNFSELDPIVLRKIISDESCLESLFLCSFSSYTAVSQEAKDVLCQVYDEDGSRIDILRTVLREDSKGSLIAMSKAIDTVRSIGIYSPCIKLITVCKDFLEALYGHGGVMYSPVGTELSSDPEKNQLYQFWKANWELLNFTYKASKVWGGTYALAVMKEFIRDEVDYCSALLDKFRLFESDIAQQCHMESSQNTGGLLAGNTIASIQNMCELLRLRDDALLHSCLRNILEIVNLMNSFKVSIPQSLINVFVQYASQEITNNLRLESIPEMLAPLNVFSDQEIEKICLQAEAKKSRRKSPAVTATMAPSQMSISPSTINNGISKNQSKPLTSSSITTSRKVSSTQTSVYQFLGKDIVRQTPPVRQIQTSPTVTSSESSAPQRISLISAARASVDNSRKSASMAAAAARPIPKEIHPPRAPGFNSRKQTMQKSEPVIIAGDSDSSDSDDEGLFTVAKKNITSTAKPGVLRNIDRSSKITLSKKPTTPQVSSREMEEQRMRLSLNIDISPLHKKILLWDFYSSNLDPFDKSEFSEALDSYNTSASYQKVFFPLLLLECWEGIQQYKQENTGTPFRLDIGRRVACDEFTDVYTSMSATEFNKIRISDSDLILLTYQGKSDCSSIQPSNKEPHCFAKVKEINTNSPGFVDLTLRTYEPTTMSPYLSQGYFLHGLKVMSLTTIEREYSSLMALEYYDLKAMILKGLMSPLPNFSSRGRELEMAMKLYSCNESQAKAIVGTTNSRGFSLIQGPPGTGKTKTILGIVGTYLDGIATTPRETITGSQSTRFMKRILVCAPSNAAVDELVVRLKAGISGQNGNKISPKIVRLGRSDVVNIQVKDVTLEDLVERSLKKVEEPDGSLRKQQNELVKKRNDLREQLKNRDLSIDGQKELDAEIKSITKNIKETGTQLDIQREQKVVAMRDRDVSRRKLQHDILSNAQIICATLSGSAHSVLAKLHLKFETVIIDEAAQCVELSCLVPLKYGCRQCIMVGDPNQLPPTVLSQTAQNLNYEQSLFVRMFKRDQSRVYLLDTQYRMHPDIARFPSSVFYSCKLKTPDSMTLSSTRVWHRGYFTPFRFFNVRGQQLSRPNSKSFYNKDEIMAIYEIYQALIRNYPDIDFSRKIGIISPYKRQVRELREIFVRKFGEIIVNQIDFNTVDGFQGQEKDIIIMSCVRAMKDATGVGFLADTRRMNVAITRAKSSLWIVGNKSNLEQNQIWGQLIQGAAKKGMLTEFSRKMISDYNVKLNEEDNLKKDYIHQVKRNNNLKRKLDTLNNDERSISKVQATQREDSTSKELTSSSEGSNKKNLVQDSSPISNSNTDSSIKCYKVDNTLDYKVPSQERHNRATFDGSQLSNTKDFCSAPSRYPQFAQETASHRGIRAGSVTSKVSTNHLEKHNSQKKEKAFRKNSSRRNDSFEKKRYRT